MILGLSKLWMLRVNMASQAGTGGFGFVTLGRNKVRVIDIPKYDSIYLNSGQLRKTLGPISLFAFRG